ncbi:AraC family transcriptional regulator ligand-binding domain-containing protein [Thalassotalea nanhaiensis]|uniref:AraC family transcriptional regulator ligand-binding domain-containing protein n=1 Tax=Thalassotalea nanhaiensis TaxID=3065648 RepID=A0ABY9TGL0_9GAMM|nr:AraC family transcriptional regulator ligand-binding domain-containing protein [Colwelliaceae bacterium SQ345]
MTATYSEFSTSFNNIKSVLKVLNTANINIDQDLVELGIDLSKYKDGYQRVSYDIADQIYSIAVTKLKDPLFAFKMVEEINPASFQAVGIALMCSDTLQDFCLRLEKFYSVITTFDKLSFVQEGNNFSLALHPLVTYRENTNVWHHTCFTAVILKLVRMVYRPDFQFEAIYLPFSLEDSIKVKYENYFQCPIFYNSAESKVVFSNRDMNVPLACANEIIASQNDLLSTDLLNKLKTGDLPNQVKALLIKLLPTGQCSREKIASMLFMSPRAFHRKLEKLDLNYQDLLDETRQELAIQYLNLGFATSDIAYRLGYTDSSNFTRSFKRWFGKSPRSYKNQA